MADLDEVLGAVLASVAKARYLADLQTAALAEQYRSHPLLQGLAVPRIRIPELDLELPVLVEEISGAESNKLRESAEVAAEVGKTTDEAVASAGGVLSAPARRKLSAALTSQLEDLSSRRASAESVPKEAVVRLAETTVAEFLRTEDVTEPLGTEATRSILAAVRRRAAEVAEASPGRAPRLGVNAMTTEVKEVANPSVTARLRIRIREEGLEWTVSSSGDGTTRRTLQPE